MKTAATISVEPTEKLMQAWIYQPSWTIRDALILMLGLSPDDDGADDQLDPLRPLLDRTTRDGMRSAAPIDWLWWGERNGRPFHSAWWMAITPQGPIGFDGQHFALSRSEMLSETYLQQERRLITKWARKPYWTSREAIDLSLNFDPYTTDGWRGQAPEVGDTIRERHDRFLMLKRAAEVADISEKAAPKVYVEWLDKCGYIVSEAWRHAVGLKESGTASRSQDRCADLLGQVEELQRELEEKSARILELESGKGHAELVEGLECQVELLKLSNQRLANGAEGPRDKSAQKRRNISLQKALLAAAVDGYGYRPQDAKSDVPSQIAEMTRKLEIDVSAQSIRKHLRESSDEHVGQKVWENFANKTKNQT